jgi:FkbM family methyltransferase
VKAQVERARALLNKKRPEPIQALQQLKPFLKNKQAPWPVFHFAGIAAALLEDHQATARYMQLALDNGGDEAETWHTLSVAQYKLENYEEAENLAREALSRQPDFFKALLNLGLVLQAQAKLQEALHVYQRANALDPRNVAVAFHIGMVYKNLGDFKKSMELFDIAIKMDPTYEGPVVEKGVALKTMREFAEAEALLREFLTRYPNTIAVRTVLADTLKEDSRYDEAVKLYEEILKDNPRNAAARVNYGLCLQEMARYDEAEREYELATVHSPELMEAMCNYLMVMHYNPNRSAEVIFEAHRKWDKQFAPGPRPERPVPSDRSPDRRLRVGFVSGGFRAHPVGWMITRGLEELSRDQFEVYCYTTSNVNDFITKRIHARADVWRPTVGYKDDIVARMVREDEIDILVELSGHAADNRLRAVAQEPAPVIVKWVGGLFNTTGLRSVDYLISDWFETPEGVEDLYTEKLVRMPDDYICFMPPEYSPEVSALPALENGYVTFGCFNNPSKVNPELVSQWARLMERVPGSRLFLKSGQYSSAEFQERIRGWMAGHGIDADRIMFEGRSSHDELLGTYGRVDVALDPWPYSGGLSTCEALWMGVPVVTLPGPTFAGRHSVTHLVNAGLPGMVAGNWDEYVDIAAGLTSDLDALAALRAGLRDQVAASPLCDGERFGAALGQALRAMWHANTEGRLKQDHIAVSLEVVCIAKTINPVQSRISSGNHDNQSESDGISSDKKIVRTGPDHDNLYIQNKSEFDVKTKETIVHDYPKTDKLSQTTQTRWQRTYEVELPSKVVVTLPESDDVITSYVFNESGKWIDSEVAILDWLVKPGNCVVDVGAGFGVYALPLAKLVGQAGHVFAIEPQESVSECLESSKRNNDFTNLTNSSEIIGKDNENVEWIYHNTPEFSTVKASKGKLKSISLDTWWKSVGSVQIDLIKLDVGDNELQIVTNASTLLKSCCPNLIISAPKNLVELEQLKNFLENNGYTLFMWIEGIYQLVELEKVEQIDSYTLNIVALSQTAIQDLSQSGIIFENSSKEVPVADDEWRTWFQELPWTPLFITDWHTSEKCEGDKTYYRVLSLIARANQFEISKYEDLSKRTSLLLEATQCMIDMHNNGACNIPEKLSLCYLLNIVGKREQAVEILLSILNETQFGGAKFDVTRPFLLPVFELNHRPIMTEFSKWMMVRLLESWLKLKDTTAYASGPMEQKIRKALEGNPEMELPSSQNQKTVVMPDIPVFVHILFNNIHAQSAVNTFERLNSAYNDMKHVCILEASRSINGFDVDVRGKQNIVVFQAARDLASVIQTIETIQPAGVIYHGLFFDWQYKTVDALSSEIRQYWVMWGGDLYNPIRSGTIRKSSIDRIYGVLTDVDGDRKLFEEVYGSRPRLPSFGYGTEMHCENDMPEELKNLIVLGNSGDASNNHIDILKNIISKKDCGEHKYFIPFSYNASAEYLKLIEHTIQKFDMRDVVELRTSFMPIELYNGMLKHSKLLVLAHQRQQAHGSIKIQLLSGKPVVLRKKIIVDGKAILNPSWKFFENGGFNLLDFDSFCMSQSLNDLICSYRKHEEPVTAGEFMATDSFEYLNYVRKSFSQMAQINSKKMQEAL